MAHIRTTVKIILTYCYYLIMYSAIILFRNVIKMIISRISWMTKNHSCFAIKIGKIVGKNFNRKFVTNGMHWQDNIFQIWKQWSLHYILIYDFEYDFEFEANWRAKSALPWRQRAISQVDRCNDETTNWAMNWFLIHPILWIWPCVTSFCSQT